MKKKFFLSCWIQNTTHVALHPTEPRSSQLHDARRPQLLEVQLVRSGYQDPQPHFSNLVYFPVPELGWCRSL